MISTRRGPAPELLERYGVEITQDYIAKKQADRQHDFRWPQRESRSVYAETRTALHSMTVGHCAYCDGFPVDATGEEQIDHFKPKSQSEFYHLVCDWQNLFFVCYGCNKAKRADWEEALLRPDADDFSFVRYFLYRSDTGQLEPNPAASADEQHRTSRTIEILKLNRPGLCIDRMRTASHVSGCPQEELSLWGYRYLVPLCRDDASENQLV